jgi:hypothetical protein
LPTIEAIDADELIRGIAPKSPSTDQTLEAIVKDSAQIAKLVKRLTAKDLKQHGCITPTYIEGIGEVVQGCLETLMNATYYPYCAKFRDELVVLAPSPTSDYEHGVGGPIVVLGCPVKVEDDEDEIVPTPDDHDRGPQRTHCHAFWVRTVVNTRFDAMLTGHGYEMTYMLF